MVNLRPPGLRRPPASRDIIDVEQVTSSSRNKETTSHRSITAKKGTSKPGSTATKPTSKPATSRTKKGKGKFAFCTLILEGSRQDPVTVDIDTTIGAVDKAPNFDDEDEEEYLKPLPSSIVLDISVKVDGKIRKAREESAQAPMDPRGSLDTVKKVVMDEVEDTYGKIVEGMECKLLWKWEKRVMAQTASTKKSESIWSKLTRDIHWKAAQKTIRDTNSKKAGLNNMVLFIEANFSLPQSLLSDQEEEENVYPNRYSV
jgi:hypothetical protein